MNALARVLVWSLGLFTSIAIAATPTQAVNPAAPAAAPSVPVVRIGVVLPRAQVGQGASAVDVGETVRQALISYMTGPGIELVPLQSRIQIQVDSEAQQAGCDFIVYTALTQTQKKKMSMGMASLMSAAAPLAGFIPGVGGAAASYASVAVANAAATAAVQEQQEQAMEAMSGASQGTVHKNDEMALQFKVYRAGEKTPMADKTLSAKAKADDEDLLSPLVEQQANEILTALSN